MSARLKPWFITQAGLASFLPPFFGKDFAAERTADRMIRQLIAEVRADEALKIAALIPTRHCGLKEYVKDRAALHLKKVKKIAGRTAGGLKR